VSFVIPDEAIPEATHQLRHAQFLTCTPDSRCRYTASEFVGGVRRLPPNTAHFHLNDPEVLLLLKKSETLWNLPVFPVTYSADLKRPDSKIILASSLTYVPSTTEFRYSVAGAFPLDLHPVRIPSSHCLVETYASLILRDWCVRDDGGHWTTMMAYVSLYIDKQGKREVDQDQIKDEAAGRCIGTCSEPVAQNSMSF
jgi:hypothetical protein